MIYVPKDHMHRIAPLFSCSADTLIRSCLEGCMGNAWADGLEHPTAAKILTTDFCFLTGDAQSPDAEALAAAVPKEYAHPWMIAVPLSPAWESVVRRVFPNCKRRERYALRKEPDAFDQRALRSILDALPKEYRLVPIDKTLYQKSRQEEWSAHLCAWFPSDTLFQTHGLGFMALAGEEPVCGASSHSYYHSGIEIEIDTKPSHRRKGLAAACGAALILECLRRGLYPSWDAANRASLALAEKLGYHFDKAYAAYQIYM